MPCRTRGTLRATLLVPAARRCPLRGGWCFPIPPLSTLRCSDTTPDRAQPRPHPLSGATHPPGLRASPACRLGLPPHAALFPQAPGLHCVVVGHHSLEGPLLVCWATQLGWDFCSLWPTAGPLTGAGLPHDGPGLSFFSVVCYHRTAGSPPPGGRAGHASVRHSFGTLADWRSCSSSRQ